MKDSLDVLRGELERLFSISALRDLCGDYLGIDAEQAGLDDESKAVFVRRLIGWCEKNGAAEALADATLLLKKGMVDPRVKQVYKGRYQHDAPEQDAVPGWKTGEQVSLDGVGAVYECVPAEGEGEEGYGLWLIHGEHAQDEAAVQRFLTQMRALRHVDHPSIQGVREAGRLEDGRPYAVIRWIEGDLVAERAPMRAGEALEVFDAILDALDAVHGKGIVHFDIRAENVLVREPEHDERESGGISPQVVLLGFGTDRLFYKPEPPGPGGALAGLGMVKAIAPEVARGGPPEPRSDYYALGALLYEMVTGKPVFEGRSAADVLAAHLSRDARDPSSVIEDPIPGAFDALVGKLLEKEPAKRPRAMDEIRRELAEVRRAAEEAEARAAQTGTREDIETWGDALIESPDDEEMLAEMLREARRCNAWGAAVEVIEEAALSADDADVVRRLYLAAAEGATHHLKDYEKANQLLTQLIEAHPDDPRLEEAMLDLLRAEGRFEELVEKLAAKAEAVEEPLAKLGTIREIARIYERDIKDAGKALDYYMACLAGGVEEDLIATVEKLGMRTERLEEVAAACGGAISTAESAGDEEGVAFLYKKLGSWYLEHLDQAGYALTCYQKVLESRPADIEALEAIADLYRGAQQWKELADAVVRIGEIESSPAKSRDRLVEAARVYDDKLGETGTARELLEGVLDEDPAHAKAAESLARILEQAEEWKQLAELLSHTVESIVEDEEQLEARYRLGELYEDRLDDLKAAREQYSAALKIDPKQIDSIKGLERIYARQGDSVGLRDNLQAQLELAVTPRQRLLLLERLAELHEEEFREDAKAIDCYREILEVDAEHGSALIALTRLFRRSKDYEDLVDILQRRAEAAEEEEEERDLLRERAEVIREDIGDVQRAAEAFQAVASLGVDDALETLARTQEEAGDYAAAVETVDKMLAAAEEQQQKIALLMRKAGLQCDRLEEHSEAVATLRKARDMAPEDRDVIAELARVYQEQGNYSGAVETLREELDLVEGSHARAELFARMGVIALEKMDNEDKAISYFEHALELNKNNLTAGDNVSTLYRKRGEWDKALPIYEIWAASSDALDDEKKIELFSQMGEAFERLDRHEEALSSFHKAAEIASEPHLMRRLGEVALNVEEYEMAREQLNRYLDAIGDKIEPADKVGVFVMLGRAGLASGDVSGAAKLARQATVMSSDHREARLLLADVNEERGDYRGAVEARQRVLDAMEEDDEDRLPLVRRTAMLLFEKLRDSDGASKMLTDELERHPEDRDILGDLLKIYYAAKRYGDVVEVVLRIADLVDDPQQLARYYLTVAKIYRRELKQPDDAMAYFEMAVEQDPTLADAEEALVEMLTERQEWEKLERHYKRAIKNLPEDAMLEEKLEAYEPLANLLVEKLDRDKDGIMITEAITRLVPEDESWREKLADLYGWKSEYADKAVALHRRMLASNPARVDSFRMLWRIFSNEEEPDKTWLAASMLSLLNQASPEERKFYRDYQPDDLPTMENRLKDEHWKRMLSHDELNQTISAIFSVMDRAVFRAKAQKLSKYGLEPGKAVEAGEDSSDFSQFVSFAAGSLGVEAPPIHFHDGQGEGFQLLDTDPPVLVAGSGASELKDRMGLGFKLGQQLSLLRPGCFVRRLASSGTEMSSWLLASIKIFVPGLPVPSNLAGPVQERLAPIREALDAAALERLQGYVQAFVSEAADVNLKRWAKAIDYTSDRAGLLLCGDVAVAVRVLKELLDDKKQLSERLRELTLFTVSDEHHQLRARLGTALKNV